MKQKDEDLRLEIIRTLENHPAYGHRRIALNLGVSKNRALRVMKKFGIRPFKIRGKKPFKKDQVIGNGIYLNCLKNLSPIAKNVVWSGDFTYMKYQGRFFYLATVLDVFSREIVGFALSFKHDRFLVLKALKNALSKGAKPIYLHSDQGSEYTSEDYLKFVQESGIQISLSDKASPWQNCFQESFYSNFKLELGSFKFYECYGEVVEKICLQLHYYNHNRIHTALKMPPAKYAEKHSAMADKLF